MKTNDIKKGMRIKLKNGWFATMADNKRGNIRMATVEGYYTETGSVYAWDIVECKPEQGADWEAVKLTPEQIKRSFTFKF
jgi:hypothetical protein